MKYNLLQLILFSLLLTFDIDDWTYFNKVGFIHSVIETDEVVHFITNNGIYSYDDIEEEYYYNFNLSNEINFNNKIHYFHFDSNTGIYWLIDEDGIKMKHSFNDFWSEISYRKLNIIDLSEIINIGSSPDYIWIKLVDRLIPLNQITGLIVNDEIDYHEINNIYWSSKNDQYGYDYNIDISNYVIFDEWDVQRNRITNNRGDILVPTAIFEDRNGNVWLGTDKGVIFKGSSYSHRLEPVNFGLKFPNITVAKGDKNMNWWFGDSQFLRTGVKRHKQNFRKNNYNFLTKWNEYNNKWKYIKTDFSMLIQNIDVNDICIIDDIIYIATMEGLLIFDEINNDWTKIDVGLYDIAVWNIENYESSIYIATSNGFDEISVISRNIIKNQDSLSVLLRNSEIYDILISENVMYIASEKGLFQSYINTNAYELISDRKFRHIGLYDDFIFASDGNELLKISLLDFKIQDFESNVSSFSITDGFIWLNQLNYCQLINIDTGNNWSFRNDLGGKNKTLRIYGINSNNDKVWFMTNNGVIIFDWDKNDYQ